MPKSRIMYIEAEGPGDRTEWARIGRVGFSKTGQTLYYRGMSLLHVGRAEYMDTESRKHYYIQTCSRDGND